jgi:hypothetical protein
LNLAISVVTGEAVGYQIGCVELGQSREGNSLARSGLSYWIISRFPFVAQLSYRFAHSHRQRGYRLDALQTAVRELSVLFTSDFREEEFRVTKDAC